MILTAAYGRCYKTKAEFMKDWNDGKDFMIHDIGRCCYCSKRDFPEGYEFECRYGKMNEKVFIMKD